MLKVVGGGLTVSSLLEGSNPTGSGGKEIAVAGGIADATRVTGRGLLIISSGGVANATLIDSRNNSGGFIVFGRGLAIGTVIDSGSTEFLSGGTEDGGIVGSGGRIVVRSGGTAIDVTISGGGSAIYLLRRTDHGGRRRHR